MIIVTTTIMIRRQANNHSKKMSITSNNRGKIRQVYTLLGLLLYRKVKIFILFNIIV